VGKCPIEASVIVVEKKRLEWRKSWSFGCCACVVSFDVRFIQLAWSVSVGWLPPFDWELSGSLVLVSSGLVKRPVFVLVSSAL
jgi:hypothetical protein